MTTPEVHKYLDDLSHALLEDERFPSVEAQALFDRAQFRREPRSFQGPWAESLRSVQREGSVCDGPVQSVVAVEMGGGGVGWLLAVGDGDDDDVVAFDTAGTCIAVVAGAGYQVQLLASRQLNTLTADEVRSLLKETDAQYHFPQLCEQHGREAVATLLWKLQAEGPELPLWIVEHMTSAIPSAKAAAPILARFGVARRWATYMRPSGRKRAWDHTLEELVRQTPDPQMLPGELNSIKAVATTFKEDVAFALFRNGHKAKPPKLSNYALAYLASEDYEDWAFRGTENIPGWDEAVAEAWLNAPIQAIVSRIRPAVSQLALGKASTLLLLHRLGSTKREEVAEVVTALEGRADLKQAMTDYVAALHTHIRDTEHIVGSLTDRRWVLTSQQCGAPAVMPCPVWKQVHDQDAEQWSRCILGMLARRAANNDIHPWLRMLPVQEQERRITASIEQDPSRVSQAELCKTELLHERVTEIAAIPGDQWAAKAVLRRWTMDTTALPW